MDLNLKLTPAEAAAFRAFWCSCDPAGDRVTYYDDDPRSTVCAKHHWRCDDCGKVRQVG